MGGPNPSSYSHCLVAVTDYIAEASGFVFVMLILISYAHRKAHMHVEIRTWEGKTS